MRLAFARRGATWSTATFPSVRSSSPKARSSEPRHNGREATGATRQPTPSCSFRGLARRGRAAHGLTVVVTLEPCDVRRCDGRRRGAALVFGAFDPKAGAAGSLYNLLVDPRLNHEVAVNVGRARAEAARCSRFFANRRRASRFAAGPQTSASPDT